MDHRIVASAVNGVQECVPVHDVGLHGVGPELAGLAGARGGSRNAGHLAAGLEEAGDDRGTDRAGGSCDENFHACVGTLRPELASTAAAERTLRLRLWLMNDRAQADRSLVRHSAVTSSALDLGVVAAADAQSALTYVWHWARPLPAGGRLSPRWISAATVAARKNVPQRNGLDDADGGAASQRGVGGGEGVTDRDQPGHHRAAVADVAAPDVLDAGDGRDIGDRYAVPQPRRGEG